MFYMIFTFNIFEETVLSKSHKKSASVAK